MNSALEKKSTNTATHSTLAPSNLNTCFDIPKALTSKYHFLQHIGSGAQGDVYKARNILTNDLVAIKLLRIDQIENWKAYDLFDREARVLTRLNISGVAKCYEALKCFDDNPPYACIVQEFIEGISLDALMKSGKRLTLTETFQIALQILNILEKLHKSNPPVIHRDLKPANIMIDQNNGKTKVYLIDFGAVSNPLVQTGGSTVAGTFGYMPPEQLMGKPSPESDLYALAATVVCMLSGISPADIQTLEFRLVIEPHLQSFPPAITHVLARMLDPSLNSRLTNYEEIRHAFNNFIKAVFDDDSQFNTDFYASDEFLSCFNNVKTLWDTGNLKLWSALPTQTPRIVPDVITSLKSAELTSHRSIRTGAILTPKNVFKLICGLTLIAYVLYRFLKFCSLILSNVLILLSFLTPALIILALSVYLIHILIKSFLTSTFPPAPTTPDYTPEYAYRLRNSLLKYGRKTIATVVSVEYKPVSNLATESYYLTESSEFNHLKRVETYIHNVPSFEITYRFNPPDDSQEDDLIHHITVHRSPFGHLQAGDPLLILYMIHPDNNDLVCSMPFPFAACDVENYEEILSITRNAATYTLFDADYDKVSWDNS